MLAGAGVTLVPPDAADLDGLVVFLSAASLEDRAWIKPAGRNVPLVPVRVDKIDDNLVPSRIRELNWIDWQHTNVAATFGFVLAGLLSDPDRRALARQLSHEAEAWIASGRPVSGLIGDFRRARRMTEVLAEPAPDPGQAPTPMVVDFVRQSLQHSRLRYMWRQTLRVAGLVLLVAALATAAVVLPAIKLGGFNNKASIVTAGDPVVLAALPEWSAANAAALLINGTPDQKVLARMTLIEALNQPWEISSLPGRNPAGSVMTFDHGSRAITAVNLASSTRLEVLDVRTTRVEWSVVVPGINYYIAVDPGGQKAVALHDGGAIVVNLSDRTWRQMEHPRNFRDGRLGTDGRAIIRIPEADAVRLMSLDTGTGAVTDLGTYDSLPAVSAQTLTGSAAALVDAGGRVSLIDLRASTTLTSMAGAAVNPVGTIAPDGRRALVEGVDGQLWILASGGEPKPTGISVPPLVQSVAWTTGDRIVVVSRDQSGQVYLLPGAEPVGVVCRGIAQLQEAVFDPDADVVACFGAGNSDFWNVPSGPLAAPPGGQSTQTTASEAGTTATADGTRLRLTSAFVDSGWFSPSTVPISVVAVAQMGTRVVVGDRAGSVTVIDITTDAWKLVTAWRSPDRSAITAVGWSSGPVATTASGHAWRVPDCGDCGTDAGLIQTFHDRMTGCFTARQLSFIAPDTRHRLGLRECEE